MDEIKLCNVSECTGCKACFNVCPKAAITMLKDAYQQIYPSIDRNKCVKCGLCLRTCPELNNVSLSEPIKVYAAWSNDKKERATSASGGIAAELYKLFVDKKGYFTGVQFNDDFYAFQDLYSDLKEVSNLKNSKYVYSDMKEIYIKIKKVLNEKQKVLFVGTPCQCAAIKNFIPVNLQSSLYLVDLICHGMSPATYLKEHISALEKKFNDKADKVYFRDPITYTYTYTFTLLNKLGKRFYSKKVYRNDVYQLGYHGKLIYNEHCYSCRYAKFNRCTDLTIGDFSGLGKEAPIAYDGHNVSCILVNTEKGNRLINELTFENRISVDERPSKEAYNYEHQLKEPSFPHAGRKRFLEQYIIKGYEKAARDVLKKEILNNELRAFFHVQEIRKIIVMLIPKKLKKILKEILIKQNEG